MVRQHVNTPTQKFDEPHSVGTARERSRVLNLQTPTTARGKNKRPNFNWRTQVLAIITATTWVDSADDTTDDGSGLPCDDCRVTSVPLPLDR